MAAQVSEDGEYVRRTTPIPDADVTLSRTVYARPFQVGCIAARFAVRSSYACRGILREADSTRAKSSTRLGRRCSKCRLSFRRPATYPASVSSVAFVTARSACRHLLALPPLAFVSPGHLAPHGAPQHARAGHVTKWLAGPPRLTLRARAAHRRRLRRIRRRSGGRSRVLPIASVPPNRRPHPGARAASLSLASRRLSMS